MIMTPDHKNLKLSYIMGFFSLLIVHRTNTIIIVHLATLCIQSRHKGDCSVGCHANHGLECSVWFVGWENLTLKEQWEWRLTEYLYTIKDHLCIRKSCKLRWQVSSHYLWRNSRRWLPSRQYRKWVHVEMIRLAVVRWMLNLSATWEENPLTGTSGTAETRQWV